MLGISAAELVILIVTVCLIAGVALVAGRFVLNLRSVRAGGLSPATEHADLAIQAMTCDLLRGAITPQERLARLDELRSTRMITEDEYTSARQRVVGQL